MVKIWIGIGCQRGITSAEINEAIEFILAEFELSNANIIGVATIDRKADETGLIEYCRDRNLPLIFYSADSLASVSANSPSDRVVGLISTPSVAEAAALLAAQSDRLIPSKQNYRCASGRSISIAGASTSIQEI